MPENSHLRNSYHRVCHGECHAAQPRPRRRPWNCGWRTSIRHCRCSAIAKSCCPRRACRTVRKWTWRTTVPRTIEFSVSGLTKGTRHAELRLVGQDALPIDDRRYLTVVVRDPWLVLIVAPARRGHVGTGRGDRSVSTPGGESCGLRVPDHHARGTGEPQPVGLCGRGDAGSHAADASAIGNNSARTSATAASSLCSSATTPATEVPSMRPKHRNCCPANWDASIVRRGATSTWLPTATTTRSCARFAPFPRRSRGPISPCFATGTCRIWPATPQSSCVSETSSRQSSNAAWDKARC